MKLPTIPVLISASIAQYKKQFPSLWKIILIYCLIANVQFFLTLFTKTGASNTTSLNQLLWIEPVLISTLSVAFILQIASGKSTLKEGIVKLSIQKTPLYFLQMMVIVASLMGGLLLFIIPGILMFLFLAFANFILVLQDASVRQSIRRSRLYITGIEWPILYRILVITLPSFAISLFLPMVFPILGSNPLLHIVLSVLNALYFPFSMIYSYKLYTQVSKRNIAGLSVSRKFKVLFWICSSLGGLIVLLALIGALFM